MIFGSPTANVAVAPLPRGNVILAAAWWCSPDRRMAGGALVADPMLAYTEHGRITLDSETA